MSRACEAALDDDAPRYRDAPETLRAERKHAVEAFMLQVLPNAEYTAPSLYAKTRRKASRADEGEESGALEQAAPDAASEAEPVPEGEAALPAQANLHRKPLRHWRDVTLTTQPSGLSIGGLCR